MKAARIHKLIFFFLMILAFFIADRGLKVYFLKNPESVYGVTTLPFFSLHLEKNEGIAFSMPIYAPALLVFIGVAIVLLLISLRRAVLRHTTHRIAGLIMILSGAYSNFYDRIFYGFVIDYIDIAYFSVFNIADMLVVAGFCAIVMGEYFGGKNKHAAL